MNTDMRIEELKKIVNTKTPCGRKDIYYKDERKTMNVFEIPVECLVYNQYNGRIATFVKTYEKQHHPIDATTSEGEKLIEQFLWESKKNRNKITQKDIKEKGQLEYGIVTADGVVIDGNRRFMLLKKNKEDYKQSFAHFKAIILEDTLKSNKKGIMALETIYQMGVDDKVDYNPIQKYLKCRDLEEQGFPEDEIANMMGEKASDIKVYLSILKLMDEYLQKYGYGGMYRILETEALEGHFVDLNSYILRYRGKVSDMNWSHNLEDIDDLKNVYFDYMRAGFGVHEIRIIAKPSKGIFTQQNLWEDFVKSHFNVIENVGDEETLQKMREESPTLDIVTLISARDKNFQNTELDNKNTVLDELKANKGRTERDLEDQKSQDEPLELLQRAKRTLEKVKTDVDGFGIPEVWDTAKKVQTLAYKLMKAAGDAMKAVEKKKKK